ncbi:MAG: hypothetical protein RR565_06550 [Erysipelothrix sp.]
MKLLEELLEGIRKRPSMYLGTKSLKLLNAYLNGFLSGSGLVENSEYQNFRTQFQKYVLELYPTQKSLGWSSIIIKVSQGDEERAFDLFFRLLDDFNKIKR